MFTARVAEHDAALPGYAEHWRRLCEQLMRHGGDLVVATTTPDPVLGLLLARELRIDPGQQAQLVRGRRRQCHQNVIRLWRKGTVRIVTGYALSADGLWRAHTWGLDSTDRIVETTEARETYAGVVLDDGLAEAFAGANDLRQQ